MRARDRWIKYRWSPEELVAAWRRRPVPCESVAKGFGKSLQQIQEDSVGPAETHDVDVVASGDCGFRRTRDGIVFFANGAVVAEIFRHGGQKFVGRRSASSLKP